MIKVLVTGRDLRQRRREMILNSPEGVEFKTLQSLTKMAPDHELSKTPERKKGWRDWVRDVVYKLHVPNIRYLSPRYLKNCDLVYTPGQMLLNNFPYIIEVDNVAALGFYDLNTIYQRAGLIKRFLKSPWCKFLVSFSEAGRKSLINTYPDLEIVAKSRVVYPYVKLNIYPQKQHDKLIILSANTKFYMKGTREVLEAFEVLQKKYNNLELWVVSNTPREYLEKYKGFSDIKFFPAKFSKEELYRDFYSQCDIFIQPSYQDTFGMTYLEVAASGKPIVSTDIFGLPEIVIDGYNGFLIKSPVYMCNPDYTLKPEYFPMPVLDTENEFYKKLDCQKVVPALIEKTSLLIENLNLRKRMGENSLELVKTKFSDEKRKKQLLEIFQSALA